MGAVTILRKPGSRDANSLGDTEKMLSIRNGNLLPSWETELLANSAL